MTIKTFEQILGFKHYAEWRQKNCFNTKLDYAINKVLKRLNKVCLDKWKGLITDIETDYASVNEKGNLIIENNIYSYTPHNTKKMREAKLALLNEWENKEFEFEPHILKEVDEDLNEEEKEVLTGFVL